MQPTIVPGAPGSIPTIPIVGPCEAIDKGHQDGANMRVVTPWPGLKPLVNHYTKGEK